MVSGDTIIKHSKEHVRRYNRDAEQGPPCDRIRPASETSHCQTSTTGAADTPHTKIWTATSDATVQAIRQTTTARRGTNRELAGITASPMRSDYDPGCRFVARAAPLVLVPGMNGTGELFYRQVPRLERSYRVATYSLREDAESLERLGADPARIVDIVAPGERRAIVVGESFGGAVALTFALKLSGARRGPRHPEFVSPLRTAAPAAAGHCRPRGPSLGRHAAGAAPHGIPAALSAHPSRGSETVHRIDCACHSRRLHQSAEAPEAI